MSRVLYRGDGLTVTRFHNGKTLCLQFDFGGKQLDIPVDVLPYEWMRMLESLDDPLSEEQMEEMRLACAVDVASSEGKEN